MSNRSIRCTINVRVDIEITDASCEPGSNDARAVAARESAAVGESGDEMGTGTFTHFDINNEEFRRNLERIREQKYEGYERIIERNQREDRQSPYEKQEGV